MKKTYLLFTFLFTCIINVNILLADCEEETALAQSVQIYKSNIFNDEGTSIIFEIYGLSENLYAIITNDYNTEVLTIRYSDVDENGVAHFKAASVSKKINYNIKVYGNTCGESILKNKNIITDTYNPYATNSICDGHWADIDYCDGFYDIKNMDEEEFVQKVQEELDKLAPKTFMDYVKSYYLFVLIPILIGTLIFIVKVILFKKGAKE